MPALTTFCNPDPQALRIAQELHRSENPTLTVLFGSRARADYAPGRSDVDILMVQDQPPTEEQDQRVKLRAQSLSASLYRGYWVPVQVIWIPLEEFEMSRRRVNGVAARAIDHGIILSNSSTDYGTWSRRAQTSYHIGRAKRHLNLFLDRQPIPAQVHPRRPAGDPAEGPAQARGRGDFAGGPDVETAVRTTGLLTAGRNPGARTDTAWPHRCKTGGPPPPGP